MFTGLITDIGTVIDVDMSGGDNVYKIRTSYEMAKVPMGASIACDGCCLTVTEKGADWFAVAVSAESLSKTTLESWAEGTKINLETSLCMGDELGGHLVSGHVDGVATLVDLKPEGDSHRLIIEVPEELAHFIAPKGSVALNGISLTVNEVNGRRFGVNIIPHTWDVTTMGQIAAGDRLNLEVDMLARYVARILGKEAA